MSTVYVICYDTPAEFRQCPSARDPLMNHRFCYVVIVYDRFKCLLFSLLLFADDVLPLFAGVSKYSDPTILN